MNQIQFLMATILLAVGLTACQTTQKPLTNDIEQTQVASDDMPFLNAQDKQPLALTLLNNNWTLVTAVDSNKQDIRQLTTLKDPAKLWFSQTSVGFDVGCNITQANHHLDDKVLSVGMMISTERYCEGLYEAEKTLTALMQSDSTLVMNASNQLFQTTANGSILVWQGELTDTAKYGEGETLFLEVAPQTADCSSTTNQSNSGQCLKMRAVYYDENWIKSGYGDWQLFDKPIEGYTHDDNLRQILRIKQYVTDPVDVKGKQLVYVLDMAVETELIR